MVNPSDAINLYSTGTTLSAIGKKYNVSRQRIWQIIKRNYNVIENTLPFHADHRINTIKPNAPEKYIAAKLIEKNYEVCFMPYNHYFDLLVNLNKVDVKHCQKARSVNDINYYYCFTELKNIYPIDYYIFVCGKLGKETSYIIPSYKIKNHIKIPVISRFKKTEFFKRYKENWKVLALKKVL